MFGSIPQQDVFQRVASSKNENVGSHDRLAPVVHSAFITCSDGAGGFMEMLRGKLENIFLKCFITVFCFV